MSMFNWTVVHDGKTPPPGESVGPMERLSWGRTAGLGAQHVVAMFGATFVFPLVMGLDPNLAILFSGICTILFLLIVQNRVPSYLGTSASFVASVAAIRAQGGDSAQVTGSILIAGLVLAAVGLLVHFAGAGLIHAVLPPAVTGAVVMLIGFNLAPVVAGIYWPQDQWIALITATFMVVAAVLLPGFWSRIAVFLALIFGYALSWLSDVLFGQIHSVTGADLTKQVDHDRVSWAGVKAADWIGFPSGKLADGVSVVHAPQLLAHVHPAGAARRDRADRGEHRPRQGGGGDDQDRPRPLHGPGDRRRRPRDRAGQHLRWLPDHDVRREHRRDGGDPRLLDGGVLRGRGGRDPARSVPEVRCGRSATPGGVLGGITVVLYGMIGLVGAKIWVENRVDFGNPVNLVGLAAGLIVGIGGVTLQITKNFSLGGIALGTILVIVYYHLVKGRKETLGAGEVTRVL